MSFPRYPKYKDSGVEWLGEVPEHWSVSPIKRHFSIVGGSTPNPEEENWDGDIVWVTPADLSKVSGIYIDASARAITERGLNSCSSSIVPKQSIVISTRAPIGSVAVAKVELCTNQGCKSLVPSTDVDPLFYVYLLSNIQTELQIRGKGTTFLELSGNALGEVEIPVPLDIKEQQYISAFLDRETTKIDALIEEQRRLIELLKEKRQAVISRAVTRGIDFTIAYKSSGTVLGQIPETWQAVQIRRVVKRVEQGWSPQCDAQPAQSGEWGVVKSGCVNRGIFSPDENKALPSTESPIPAYEIRNGDVLMSRASGSPELVGSTALVEHARPRLMLSDKIFRLHFNSYIVPGFFVAGLNSQALRLQIESAISGADGLANNLPQSSLKEFVLPLPPLAEQTQIIHYIDTVKAKIDQCVLHLESATILLQERRAALISAAVTGKIDVRNYKPTTAAAPEENHEPA